MFSLLLPRQRALMRVQLPLRPLGGTLPAPPGAPDAPDAPAAVDPAVAPAVAPAGASAGEARPDGESSPGRPAPWRPEPLAAGTQARRHPHWQGLDGLRALAVAAVVVFHFWPSALPGGYLGVDIFFVISGYLITRLLTGEYVATGGIRVAHFYRRRARRLLPALAVLLAAVSAAALIWRDQLGTLRPGVLATAVFGGNWWLALSHQPYFQSVGRPSMLQHLWSLGVEEQFYLFWPMTTVGLLALWLRRRRDDVSAIRRGVGRLALVAVAISLVSTGLTWLLADLGNVPYGNDGSTLYYGTDTHCMGLLLGAALGAGTVALGGEDRLRALGARSGRVLDIVGLVALAGVGWTVWHLDEYSLLLYRGGLLLVAALVAVVIAAAARPDSLLGRALDVRWMRWIGVRSYSIYLWHWPIAVVSRPGLDTHMPQWLDQCLRLALTLLLSDFTYRLVETPVRRLGLRATLAAVSSRIRAAGRSWPPSREVLATASLAAIGAVGIGVLVAGPSAPAPPKELAGSPGGTHLALTRTEPSPAAPVTHPSSPAGHKKRESRRRVPPSRLPLPRISGYGDSVLLGARSALAHVFPGGSIDAVEGRQPRPILADVRAAAHAGRINPLVILHLGDNGLIDPADLSRTLHLLSRARLVLVLTDHIDPYTDSWQDPNNATIDRIVPRFRNARIVRWNEIAASHPGWLYGDGVHLTPAGASGYARLIEGAWRADT